jgi:hypothetical protein
VPVERGDTQAWITEPILVVEYDPRWAARAHMLIERLTARLDPWDGASHGLTLGRTTDIRAGG